MVKLVTANELRDDEKLAHCLYDNTTIGQTFKTKDPEWHTPKHVNTYLVACLGRYEMYGRIDEELWESFQEDFEDWTEDLFALAEKKIRTPLRDFLRDNGVCVGGTKYISKQLYNVVQEDEYQEWPAEEVTKQMRTGRDFNSYQNPTFPAKLEESRNTPGPRTTTTPGPAERQTPGPAERQTPGPAERQTPGPAERQTPGPAERQTPGPAERQTPGPAERQTPGPAERQTPGPAERQTPGPAERQTPGPAERQTPGPAERQTPGPAERQTPGPAERQTPGPAERQTPGPAEMQTHGPAKMQTPGSVTMQIPHEATIFGQTPPFPPAQDLATMKALTDLAKLYNNEALKFSGEKYDILDAKLKIFRETCRKADIQPYQYQEAFSTMLKGFFHTTENHQLCLQEWRSTTFHNIIAQNLELLIDKLQKVQKSLSGDYQADCNLRDQLVNACQGVPACKMARAGWFPRVDPPRHRPPDDCRCDDWLRLGVDISWQGDDVPG